MKICPECSKENLDDAKFCTGCGFDLTDVESKADVTVSVINEATGRPVGNATVIIYNDKSKVSLKGTTGVVGDCTIKNVPYGEYTISAEAGNYKTGSNSVTINAEDVFEEINIKEKTSKSKLKIIGALLIIIILLSVGLFVTSNMNQLISDSSGSDANAVDQQITSNNVDDDNTHNGRPLCDVRQISSLSGYMIIQDGDVTIAGTATEDSKIRNYLEAGFYYE